MVSIAFINVDFFSHQNSKTCRSVGAATQWSSSSLGEKAMPDCGYCLRASLLTTGVSANITRTMASWRQCTTKQYSLAWQKWCLWNFSKKTNPVCKVEVRVINYSI